LTADGLNEHPNHLSGTTVLLLATAVSFTLQTSWTLLHCTVKACSYESQHKLDLSSIVFAVPGPAIPSLYNGMSRRWFFFIRGGGVGSFYLL